jgi:hypothetical protein
MARRKPKVGPKGKPSILLDHLERVVVAYAPHLARIIWASLLGGSLLWATCKGGASLKAPDDRLVRGGSAHVELGIRTVPGRAQLRQQEQVWGERMKHLPNPTRHP